MSVTDDSSPSPQSKGRKGPFRARNVFLACGAAGMLAFGSLVVHGVQQARNAARSAQTT